MAGYYSLYPNYILKLPSNFFCLNLKELLFLFLQMSETLFASHPLSGNFFMHVCILGINYNVDAASL